MLRVTAAAILRGLVRHAMVGRRGEKSLTFGAIVIIFEFDFPFGRVGAWRSPVAHQHGGLGVAGSNPVAPTIFKCKVRRWRTHSPFVVDKKGAIMASPVAENVEEREQTVALDHLSLPGESILIQLVYGDGSEGPTGEVLATFDDADLAAVGATPEEAKRNLRATIEREYSYLSRKRAFLSERLLHTLNRLEKVCVLR